MPKYRMQYAKEGPARYLSHLDLLRVFERAARRAGLPLAFTQGFNPHPRISFAAPLGVGTAGQAEFADLELVDEMPAAEVAGSLSANLPEGLKIVEAREVPENSPPLMAAVERAAYRAAARPAGPVSPGELKAAVESFLSLPEILVERRNKAGEKKKFDVRPGIFAMSGKLDDGIIIIEAELKTGSSGNVRLEEVLGAFLEKSRLPVEGRFVLCRTALYPGGKDRKTLW